LISFFLEKMKDIKKLIGAQFSPQVHVTNISLGIFSLGRRFFLAVEAKKAKILSTGQAQNMQFWEGVRRRASSGHQRLLARKVLEMESKSHTVRTRPRSKRESLK
jgi:hypothetical protein